VLQIQRHICNSKNVPRIRVMARVSVRARVIRLGLGLGKTNRSPRPIRHQKMCISHELGLGLKL